MSTRGSNFRIADKPLLNKQAGWCMMLAIAGIILIILAATTNNFGVLWTAIALAFCATLSWPKSARVLREENTSR